MANNLQAEAVVSAGSRFLTAEVTAYGDSSTHAPGCFLVIVSGSEGAQTFAEVVGGAGAVSAGVQRMTLASDDPAVATLGGVSDAAATQGSTGSISAKLRTVTSQLNTIASTGIPITGTVTVGSHAVTNAGTFVVQENGAALTALQLIDDVVYVDNASFTDDASKFALIGGVYQSSPQTITDGRVAPILLDANGRVVVGTHAVTQSGTWNVGTVTTVTTVSTVTNVATIGTSVTPGTSAAHLGKAEDAAHSSGDTGVAVLGVRRDTPAVGSDSDGDYSTFNFDSSGRLWCNVNNTVTVASHAVTNAGTFAVQDATAQASLSVMDDWDNAASDGASVSGDVAHDAVDAGEPVKVGFKAESSPKGITLVADGDRTDAFADIDGLQMVKLNTSGADLISEAVSNTDGNSTAFTNFGATASTYNYVTGFQVFRTDNGTTPIYVDFRDGTAGSVLWRAVLPPNGGANSPPYNGPGLFKTSVNTALAFDVSAATTTVYISISGYKGKT